LGAQSCLRLSLRTSISKKLHLGPQNGPGSENLLKIVNGQNGQKTVLSHLEKVGGPRYPPGSFKERKGRRKVAATTQATDLGSDSSDEIKTTTVGLPCKIGDGYDSRSKLFHIRVTMTHAKIDTLL
jgi:hypothetical protein